MSDRESSEDVVTEPVPLKKLPVGDPSEVTQETRPLDARSALARPPVQKTLPGEPMSPVDRTLQSERYERDTLTDPTDRPRFALSRPLKIVLGAVGALAVIAGALLLYVTLRFEAIVTDSIRAEAKERGMKLQFDEIEATGILPWHSGEPKVVLRGVTLKSTDAPDVDMKVDRLDVPLKGVFPAYEPEIVIVDGVSISTPDFASIIALERSAKTGKASKTPAMATDAKIRVEKLAPALPLSLIGTAERIDIADGDIELQDVTLEVPVPFIDLKIGPTHATIERTDDMTWARLDDYKFARFGLRDDAMLAKLQSDPVDSQGVGQRIGVELPPMKISGEAEAFLKGDEAMTGNFSVLLDGYVPPHPKELDGILHEKKTKLTGKMRYAGDVIHFEDLVVESGGLKLKGKGKVDWASGGVLTLNLAGSVGCAQLATSVVGSRLGPLAGSLTGTLTGSKLSGTVGVRIDIAAKVTELNNLGVNPKVSIGCTIAL